MASNRQFEPLVSRLLQLPRELRNHIYSYLYHDVDFCWHWTDRVAHEAVPPSVHVHLHNAPQFSVFQVHPCLKAEYVEASWTKDLLVTVRLGVHRSSFGRMPDELKLRIRTLPEILHARLHHVTILIDCGHGGRCDRKPDRYFWDNLHYFVDVLHEQAPALSSLKIAIQYQSPHQLLHPINRPMASDSPEFLCQPPPLLAHMPLVQRCVGYRLDKDIRRRCTHGPTLHGLVIYDCYLYTCSNYEKLAWSPVQVVDQFPMNPHIDPDGLPAAIQAPEMKQWKEAWPYRGDGVDWT